MDLKKPTSNPPEPYDFSTLLRNEFMNRCRKNKSYSLRAFSYSLGISPSTLSGFMNKKRPLSKKSMFKIVNALNLSLEETKKYANNEWLGSKKLPSFQSINLDIFTVISEWYHFAILELFNIKGFDTSYKSIAHTLNITQMEAKFALRRLEKVNLVEPNKEGKLQTTGQGFNSYLQKDFTNSAFKKLHAQLLEKATLALNEIHIQERDSTAITMAVRRRDMPKIKKKIAFFRRELSNFLKDKKNADSVYQLVIDFFPLSKKIEK